MFTKSATSVLLGSMMLGVMKQNRKGSKMEEIVEDAVDLSWYIDQGLEGAVTRIMFSNLEDIEQLPDDLSSFVSLKFISLICRIPAHVGQDLVDSGELDLVSDFRYPLTFPTKLPQGNKIRILVEDCTINNINYVFNSPAIGRILLTGVSLKNLNLLGDDINKDRPPRGILLKNTNEGIYPLLKITNQFLKRATSFKLETWTLVFSPDIDPNLYIHTLRIKNCILVNFPRFLLYPTTLIDTLQVSESCVLLEAIPSTYYDIIKNKYKSENRARKELDNFIDIYKPKSQIREK